MNIPSTLVYKSSDRHQAKQRDAKGDEDQHSIESISTVAVAICFDTFHRPFQSLRMNAG